MYYITIKKNGQKRGHKQFFFDNITAKAQFNVLSTIGVKGETLALYKENTKDYFKPILIEEIKF